MLNTNYNPQNSKISSDEFFNNLNVYSADSASTDVMPQPPTNVVATLASPTTGFAGGSGIVYAPNKPQQFLNMVLQTDGKILISSSQGMHSSPVLLRYNPDGSLDNSFGTNGIASVCGCSWGLAVQSDGNIIVASVLGGAESPRSYIVARYTSTGSIDTTFGTNGSTITPISSSSSTLACVNEIQIQQDGKIIILSDEGYTTQCYVLQRYTTSGSLDSTFGVNGRVVGSFPNNGAGDIVIQPDGKIVVYAKVIPTGGVATYGLIRYNTDGTIDNSFGNNGVAIIQFEYPGQPKSVAIQPDGKFVVTGGLFVLSNPSFYFIATARFNSDGSIDTGFGNNGVAEYMKFNPTASFPNHSIAFDIAVQQDGKIVVSSLFYILGNGLSLLRYNSDGTIDRTFGSRGVAMSRMSNSVIGLFLCIQPDAKLLVSGFSDDKSGASAIGRYLPNGQLDMSGASAVVTFTPPPASPGVSIAGYGAVGACGNTCVAYAAGSGSPLYIYDLPTGRTVTFIVRTLTPTGTSLDSAPSNPIST